MTAPTYAEILSLDLTEAQARQFMAEQAHMRQVEWDAKYKIPRGDLFA